MNNAKNASYQRRFRDQLRDKGYIKKECWIPPEYASVLKRVERALRNGVMPIIPAINERKLAMTQHNPWNTQTLFEALNESADVESDELSVELIDGSVIKAAVTELRELPSFVTVSGDQILVMTTLWGIEEVDEAFRARLNEDLLRANTLVPLSDFAIVGENYVLFGALSVTSSLEDVIMEITMLAENTVDAIESYGEKLFN